MKMQAKWLVLLAVIGMAAGAALQLDHEAKMLPVRVEANGERSTNDVLHHIGMTRVKSPNHHRKRLASQSRKSHSSDSQVYIIKLPPNTFYYEGDSKVKASSNNVNRIPMAFKSNGKPGKIYHWNLPFAKKMAGRKASKDSNQLYKPAIWQGEKREIYYKPKKPSKEPFHKFFPGNGKPDSLYVIENRKRTHRQPLRIKN